MLRMLRSRLFPALTLCAAACDHLDSSGVVADAGPDAGPSAIAGDSGTPRDVDAGGAARDAAAHNDGATPPSTGDADPNLSA